MRGLPGGARTALTCRLLQADLSATIPTLRSELPLDPVLLLYSNLTRFTARQGLEPLHARDGARARTPGRVRLLGQQDACVRYLGSSPGLLLTDSFSATAQRAGRAGLRPGIRTARYSISHHPAIQSRPLTPSCRKTSRDSEPSDDLFAPLPRLSVPLALLTPDLVQMARPSKRCTPKQTSTPPPRQSTRSSRAQRTARSPATDCRCSAMSRTSPRHTSRVRTSLLKRFC